MKAVSDKTGLWRLVVSSSFAAPEVLDRCEKLDMVPAKGGVPLDEGASANRDRSEMAWLTHKLMSRLVGDSITRALAAYMESQDLKGL
jgi:hypothetical protein